MSTITAKAGGGVIKLTNGNDIVYLGKGKDTIYAGANHGSNNIIYGYDSSKDVLEIAKGVNVGADGMLGYSMIGNDLVLRLGKTKMTLRNMLNKSVKMKMPGSSQAKPFTPYKELTNEVRNVSYAKKGSSYDWTKVVANGNFSGKFKMWDFNENLRIFDARKTTYKIEVEGSSGNDIIYGGSYNGYSSAYGNYGNVLMGNGGNDTIYCGNGANTVLGGSGDDTIYFGKGQDHLDRHADYDNDTVYNFNAKQDRVWLHEDCGDIKKVAVDGKDLVITIGQNYKKPSHGNGSLRIVGGALMGGIWIDGKRMAQRRVLGQTVSYNSKTRKLKVLATNVGSTYNLADYAANALDLDAGKLQIKATLKGNNLSNTIIAGKKGSNIYAGKGNDKITCGAGADTIYYRQNDGSETIYNFNAKQDVVKVSKDCGTVKSVAIDGRDVVVTLGQNKANKLNGTLRFKNAAHQKNIRIQGERAGQTKTQAQIVSYTSNNGTLKALTTKVGGTYNLEAYSVNARKLDAGNLKVYAKLIGNAQDNTIIAGWAGGDIRGGIGNDKITCGNGKDRIWFGKDDGKDTVFKSGKNDVAYFYGVKNINQLNKAKLKNGVMTLSIKGASDALNISGWQAGKSLATVELANHKKYTFGANGSFKLTK